VRGGVGSLVAHIQLHALAATVAENDFYVPDET
jgi:hypothetical protein